jgi:4-methyl-5(b-hydroxyethyl)-thiazole monophosphate biosynthesis
MASILVLLAEGFEELEAVTVVDVLRRAEIKVTMAGLKAGPVKSARGVRIVPDTTIDEVNPDHYDMVVLPGGQPGTDNLVADQRVREILVGMQEKDKYTAAICAAPYVLSEVGILAYKCATSYPSFQPKLKAKEVLSGEKVVVDGKVVTSQGPGTAIAFALKLVELFKGKDKAEEIQKAMLVNL